MLQNPNLAMPLLINIRQVERSPLLLAGELPVAELDWDTRDEMIRVTQPLQYALQAERAEKSVFVHGELRQRLDCECVRCLKPFTHEIHTADWTCWLALEGEDKAPVVNDCVDLTPYIRDDIFLAFPQHPLCSPQCNGLADVPPAAAAGGEPAPGNSGVWEALDKLKL